MSPQPLLFDDHGSTQQSGNDSGPRIAVATDLSLTGLAQLVAAPRKDRLYIGVFAGAQRTGGYGVHVDRVERDGSRLLVRATFSAPAAGAITVQILTSPAHLVSIEAQGAAGTREAVLLDQSGAERARTTVTQSTP